MRKAPALKNSQLMQMRSWRSHEILNHKSRNSSYADYSDWSNEITPIVFNLFNHFEI